MKDAGQVVDLVLEQAGAQVAARHDGDLVAVKVVSLDLDVLEAADLLEQLGEAQAALLALDVAAMLEDDRVDQHQLVLALGVAGRGVDDDQLVGKRHLVGGQAQPLGVVHQLQHPAGVEPDLLIDRVQRPGLVPQRRMGVADNLHAMLQTKRIKLLHYSVWLASLSG
jgi:hypothetical protein